MKLVFPIQKHDRPNCLLGCCSLLKNVSHENIIKIHNGIHMICRFYLEGLFRCPQHFFSWIDSEFSLKVQHNLSEQKLLRCFFVYVCIFIITEYPQSSPSCKYETPRPYVVLSLVVDGTGASWGSVLGLLRVAPSNSTYFCFFLEMQSTVFWTKQISLANYMCLGPAVKISCVWTRGMHWWIKCWSPKSQGLTRESSLWNKVGWK